MPNNPFISATGVQSCPPAADGLLSRYPMVILKTSQLIQYITNAELTRDEAVYTWIHRNKYEPSCFLLKYALCLI